MRVRRMKISEGKAVNISQYPSRNHGGAGMFCSYNYNPNICKDSYFSALQGEQAATYANKIAAGRGGTKDVGKFKPFIVCHIPELVKLKPNKQHGDGNKF